MVHPNLLEDEVRNKDKGEGGIGDAPKITTKANEASPTTSSLRALNFPRVMTTPDTSRSRKVSTEKVKTRVS